MSPVWSQSYTLFGRGLAFSAVIASLPILTLLFLLGVRRKPAWFASLFALLVALVIALFAYKLPPTLTFSSAGYGAGFGLFPICWIVFWAISPLPGHGGHGQIRNHQVVDGQPDQRCAPAGPVDRLCLRCIRRRRGGFWNPRRRCRGHVGWPRLLALLCLGAMPGGQHRPGSLWLDRDTRDHPGRDNRLAPG